MKRTKKRLVVIGNGMAGIRCVESLCALAPERYQITVLDEEPYLAYNRILLSRLLAGDRKKPEIVTHPFSWYHRNRISLHTEARTDRIDTVSRLVFTSRNKTFPYDRLVIATGSGPVRIPVEGQNLSRVLSFRSLADVERMKFLAGKFRRATVIGGGLLGLEAAWGLRCLGMQVKVIHLPPVLMEKHLDAESSEILTEKLTAKGIEILRNSCLKVIEGDSERGVTGIGLSDGKRYPTDMVVMAAGVAPNKSLAERSGIACNRGILVNENMDTDTDAVSAVGECVEFKNKTFGLLAPVRQMARVCAENLAKDENRTKPGIFVPKDYGTGLKIPGISVFTAGESTGSETCESVCFRDRALGVYKKLLIRDNRLKGFILMGDTSGSDWYLKLMTSATDLSEFRSAVIFGPDASKGANINPAAQVALRPDEEICGCNGVNKKTITDAISKHSLRSLKEVREFTRASSSCGNCTGLVEQILREAAGGASLTQHKSMCDCTTMGHQEFRKKLRERFVEHDSLTGVLKHFNWKTPDGCHKCRPAVNYYLICRYPGSYQDESRSRLVNERLHANIQKDGTYSVVPRMFGGMTSAEQLRNIADIAEKYRVPALKVTGGQRIDLLGIEKDSLPGIWKDLNDAGMVSGHAYGKALRTVKTCVGSEWCRFGTQDSTGLGIRLEELCWGAWTPHKVKMGVSGCPRNCAEATIKDIGFVAVESGWEIYLAGNGGARVRAADLVRKVSDDDAAIETGLALLQLYRENAHYLERTAGWLKRVGLSAVLEALSGPETEKLAGRFLSSQKQYRQDPWKRLRKGKNPVWPPVKDLSTAAMPAG